MTLQVMVHSALLQHGADASSLLHWLTLAGYSCLVLTHASNSEVVQHSAVQHFAILEEQIGSLYVEHKHLVVFILYNALCLEISGAHTPLA